MAHLTERQLKILDFERNWWRHAGTKPAAIAATFDVDPATYQAELDAFIFTDAAYDHDRILIKRLRRLSAQRRRQGRTAPRTIHQPAPSGGSTCRACGQKWPAHQLNLRGRCPNCLWNAA